MKASCLLDASWALSCLLSLLMRAFRSLADILLMSRALLVAVAASSTANVAALRFLVAMRRGGKGKSQVSALIWGSSSYTVP